MSLYKKTVIFTGASMSASFGYPLTGDLLPLIPYLRKMSEPNLVEIWRNVFEELRTADELIIVDYSIHLKILKCIRFFTCVAMQRRELRINVIQLKNDRRSVMTDFSEKTRTNTLMAFL